MNVAFAFREVHRFNAESPVELRRAAEKMPDGDIADYILDPRCIFAAADEGGEVRSE